MRERLISLGLWTFFIVFGALLLVGSLLAESAMEDAFPRFNEFWDHYALIVFTAFWLWSLINGVQKALEARVAGLAFQFDKLNSRIEKLEAAQRG